MLTCEICGEQVILEEDMKTHLLLIHMENEMTCPFCCLSGVSYDELCFHIGTAHPDSNDRGPADAAGTGHRLGTIPHRPTQMIHRALGQPERCEKAAASTSICNTNIERVSLKTSSHPGLSVCMGVKPDHKEAPEGWMGPMTKVSSEIASNQKPCGPGRAPPSTTPDPLFEAPHSQTKTPDPITKTATIPTETPGSEGSSRHREEDEKEGVGAGHCKAKQKRLSSPRKEKQYQCPMCALVCSDCFILQEHVELHLQGHSAAEDVTPGAAASSSSSSSSAAAAAASEESPSSASRGGGTVSRWRLECPLCSLLCEDSSTLQEHVELHLEYSTDNAVDSSTDLSLARRLQEEEEEKRRRQEAKREAEDFKKLQKQFGLDGSGGYRRQMEKTLEKAVSRGQMVPADFHSKRAEMMESLASGLDDGQTRTQGLMGALYEWYRREARDCVQVWLCAETDHFCSSDGDKGWGCGYRNVQMLLSCLNRTEPYATRFPEGSIPSIPKVQSMIETAWREGLDPQGASHFNQRLQGTRAWIGATEIYSLLTLLGVSARIVDFHQPSGPGDTHPRLFDWVKQYFSLPASRGTRLPPRVVHTSQPPIYLQHQGHSRSIVGLEQRKNGALCVLLLDPGSSPGDVGRLLRRDAGAALAAVRCLRKSPGQLKHRQYQVVAAEGVLSPEARQTRIQNSRMLRAERIP